MDEEKVATARLDSVVESDVARGFRIRALPEDVRFVLKENGIESPAKVKFLGMNAGRRRDINEEVQKRYHRDLRDPDILSNAQIRELVEKRGEWSRADEARMDELHRHVQTEMLELWREGYSDEGEAWRRDIVDQSALIQAELEAAALPTEEKERFDRLFLRWTGWSPEQQQHYSLTYAVEQGLEQYRPDRDLNDLLSLSPNILVADALNRIEELRDKQRRLLKLAIDMQELQLLRLRHARIFSGSAESRQANAEELAQIYFACEALDEHDKVVTKRLASTFDQFYEWPHEAVKWLLQEAYFFHNDIPEVAARQYLEAYGFRRVERANEEVPGETGVSDASLVPPPSSTDSESVTGMASASTA